MSTYTKEIKNMNWLELIFIEEILQTLKGD